MRIHADADADADADPQHCLKALALFHRILKTNLIESVTLIPHPLPCLCHVHVHFNVNVRFHVHAQEVGL
jgi:hypothetical protein